MKVISTGKRYEIYEDDLRTYDKLPAKVFVIRFSKMTGFYLEESANIEIKESKIYGVHIGKVNKVLTAFENFERSLGTILSGDKGIGKSLFAKILSVEALKKGYPVVIVDTYYPGIASYIEDINQEVLVLFDEFDKTFGGVRAGDGDADPQASLLSLFDGLSQGKKLFVITCNNLYKVNEYLVNRPGRFHYHFRFKYPTAEEVRAYLEDKLKPEYYSEIEKVVSFSRKTNLNYDCLRAISYELNLGEKFEIAIADLNILNLNEQQFNLTLRFKNGETFTSNDCYLDMFSNEIQSVWLDDSKGKCWVCVKFKPCDSIFDRLSSSSIILAEHLEVSWDEEEVSKETVEIAKTWELDELSITKKNTKEMHYLV